jgi:predicted dehydrogenase
MKKVKIGIIGTGVGIRTHLNGFRLFDTSEIIAICGSSLNRSQDFAQKYAIPIACANYKELCDIPEIDLVCVTSPNRYHFDAVKYAIEKEKHIVCEKPLSDNEKEINELVNAVRDYSKIVVVDHQLRFNPYIKKIKELITSEELGDIYTVKLNQKGTSFAASEVKWMWSFDGKQGGGVRLAMASHFNDLIQFWFGDRKVIGVNAYLNPVTKTRKDNNGVSHEVTGSTICNASILMEDELNVLYSINAGSYMGSIFEIEIFGSEAELTFSLNDKLSLYHRNDIGKKQSVLVDGVFEDERENKISIFSGSFRYFAPLLLKAIQTNDFGLIANVATFVDAQYNIRILDAIKQSANTSSGIVLKKTNNNHYV